MKKKKIIIENDLIAGGGVEQVMFNLVMFLRKHHYSVTVVTNEGTDKQFYSHYPKDVKYFSRQFDYRTVKRFTPRWAAACIRYRLFCIKKARVFAKTYHAAIAIKEGQVMKNISSLKAKHHYAWVHTDYQQIHWTKYSFQSNDEELACMRSFDQVVCVSQAAANSVIQTIGDPGNLCVRYNPLPVHNILQNGKKNCGLVRPAGKPLFVSVGRISGEKQYPLLIDVCAKLADQYDFELWIIGDGPDYAKLEQKIRERKISCVKLLGKQKNPHCYVNQADCFISSSRTESYGLAIQEALVLQVPVIAVACPAIEECVAPEFGWLVENSADAIEQAMIEAMEKPQMLKQCRESIKKKYDIQSLWQQRLESICALWEKSE